MVMTGRLKLGVIAFLLFDVLLAAVLVSLYLVRVERETVQELRELGVTVYPESRDIAPFQLQDQYGNGFGVDKLVGQWSLVFFGFTSCPDICPLTMAQLSRFYAGLDPADREALQVIMVSVDPQRDDSATMAAYLETFHEDFLGLTGEYDAIASLAAQFFVAHSNPVPARHDAHDEPATDYLIEHSGHLALIDPSGKFYGVVRSPVRDRDLNRTFQLL